MKKLSRCFIFISTMAFVFLISSLTAFSQEDLSFSEWSLWLGSHYTGFENYGKKVGEFDRGKKGAVPEVSLNFSGYKEDKSLEFFGYYYDPERISLEFSGRSKDVFSGIVSYNSFYHQYGTDLLSNLMTISGPKMVTYEDKSPGVDFGYTRHQIKSDFKINVPGKAKLKIIASHRSILKKGKEQEVVSMHCSSCHMSSRSVEVDRHSHTASIGFEVNPEPFLFSYMVDFRSFKSEAPLTEELYDDAQHPLSGAPMDFDSRVIFNDSVVAFGKISQNQKIAHTVKAKTLVGKSEIMGSFTNSQAKNISAGLGVNSNSGALKYVIRPSRKTKIITLASLSRIKNEQVYIDLPEWRPIADPRQFDYIRYSNLTRTTGKGSAEFIYQPERKYQLSVLAGYEQVKRDDYPDPGSDGKTTKLKFSIGGKYRAGLKFSGRIKYFFENTKNPSPYNLIFERSGDTSSVLYYYQREDLRYGKVTNQPTMLHGVNLNLSFKLNQKANFSFGLTASIGTNSDTDTLDFERTELQPNISLNFAPTPKWNLFSSLSYSYNKSNGLAAVAMMDG